MKSLFAKASIAAAAIMITLTPALADRNDHRHRGKSHHAERGYNHYGNNFHGHRHARKHFGHRHWMKRYYGYGYGYDYGYGHKPHRHWR